jgi:hypothetical protein
LSAKRVDIGIRQPCVSWDWSRLWGWDRSWSGSRWSRSWGRSRWSRSWGRSRSRSPLLQCIDSSFPPCCGISMSFVDCRKFS